MRLIDADELHKELEKKGRPIGYNEYKLFYDLIDEAPTVDQWHYPSKGEYPTEGETVLVAFQEGGPWYFTDAEYHEGGWASAVDLGHIIAWRYIIPPKEEA